MAQVLSFHYVQPHAVGPHLLPPADGVVVEFEPAVLSHVPLQPLGGRDLGRDLAAALGNDIRWDHGQPRRSGRARLDPTPSSPRADLCRTSRQWWARRESNPGPPD